MIKTRIPATDYITALCAAFTGLMLLRHSAAVSQGLSTGMLLCARILVPALFPFMTLSCWLAYTNAAELLSLPLRPVTTGVFRLPKELGAIVLLSFVGGYPVGAKSISLLLKQRRIDADTASRMMCFCMNAGPPFVITAVGAGLLRNRSAGMCLLAGQVAASLIVGAVMARRAKAPQTPPERAPALRGAPAFVEAVSASASAMISVCAYVMLFSAMLSLANRAAFIPAVSSALNIAPGIIRAALAGLFEVTSGCVNSALLGGVTSVAFISACLSFGGLSILFQVISCFRGEAIDFKPLLLSRFFHASVSVCVSVPLWRFAGPSANSQTVFAPTAPPVFYTDTRSIFIACCMLGMCAVLTLDHCYCLKKGIK